MAGICGWLRRSDASPLSVEQLLDEMAESLPRRGTDRRGTGDSTAAMQLRGPAAEISWHTDGPYVAGILGEPRWNGPEHAARAAREGHASTVINAYVQRGADFLQGLVGRFVVILYNRADRSALLAIDRMGTLPICYSTLPDGGLVFASTATAVRKHPEVDDSISHQGIFEYLFFHMVPSPGTVFRGISKLAPATVLTYRDGKTNVAKYWQPVFVERQSESLTVLETELHEHLRAAVRRCSPDEHTGTFLSGGTDSSTITGVLAQIAPGRIPSYSIGFAEQGYDEIRYARIAAEHFGTEQHEYYITARDVAEAFPVVASAYDEPFGNSSAIPTLFCARLAYDQGSRVLLAGDGGDELFGGNTRYAMQKVFEAYSGLPHWMRAYGLEPLFLGIPGVDRIAGVRKVASYIHQARIPMPERTERYNFLLRVPSENVFAEDFLGSVDTGRPLQALRDTYRDSSGNHLTNRMLQLDWKFTLADNDLRKVSHMCEIAGIRVCYPMLDDDVVALSNRILPQLKVRGLKLRYFFKHALRDFLPPEILAKSKHGFGLPFGEWLKNSSELQDVIYGSLTDLKSRRIVRSEFVDHLIDTHRAGHAAYYGTMIWVLAMLEQWLRQHSLRVE